MVSVSRIISFRGSDSQIQRESAPSEVQSSGLHEGPQMQKGLVLDSDVFAHSAKQAKGKLLTKKEKERLEHQKLLKSETEGLKFKLVKLKFYPEDQEKMDKMSVRERIEYRRKLKEEGRYTVVNPEVMDEK